MKELIKTIKDFKIIPVNFQSASTFQLLEVNDETFKIKLQLSNIDELNDYTINSSVEVFGVNNTGLVYFRTKIINKDNDILILANMQDYSIIQRREYTRVGFKNGNVQFIDFAPDFIEKIEDISAGGLKFTTNYSMELDKTYAIKIVLSTNMTINCDFQPVRIIQNSTDDKCKYTISGRFINLESMDRIVLVQHSFKIKMEQQNQTGGNIE